MTREQTALAWTFEPCFKPWFHRSLLEHPGAANTSPGASPQVTVQLALGPKGYGLREGSAAKPQASTGGTRYSPPLHLCTADARTPCHSAWLGLAWLDSGLLLLGFCLDLAFGLGWIWLGFGLLWLIIVPHGLA